MQDTNISEGSGNARGSGFPQSFGSSQDSGCSNDSGTPLLPENRIWAAGRPFWQVLLLLLLGAVTFIGVVNIFSGTTIEQVESLTDISLSFPMKEFKHAGYSLAAILLLLLIFNKIFKREALVLLAVPVIMCMAGKGLALLSLTTFSLSCLGIGGAIYRFFDSKSSGMQQVMPSFLLGICINSYIIWVAIHFTVNYTFTYFPYFFLTILLFRTTLLRLFGEMREGLHPTGNPFAVKIIICAAVFYLIYTLVPSYQHDDCMHHMYIPKYVSVYHDWHFNPLMHIWAMNTSTIPKGAYTALFVMGDQFAVRVFVGMLMICSLMLAESYARSAYNKRTSLFLTLAMVTTPYLVWVTALIFIDTLSLLMSTVVFIHVLKSFKELKTRNVYFYFMLIGFGLLCKQMAVIYFVPSAILFLCAILKHTFKTREYTKPIHFLAGILVIAVVMAPLLICNYHKTDNPIFPYCNTVFKSAYYPNEDFDGNRKSLWNNPLNHKTIYDITFHGGKYAENTDNNFGTYYFQFLVFLPLLLFGARLAGRRMTAIALLFALVIYTTVMFSTSGLYTRYFTGILFAGSLLVALIMNRFMELMESNRGARIVAGVLLTMTFAMNFVVQNSQIAHIPRYPVEEAIKGDHPNNGISGVYDYANLKYGKHSQGLIVNNYYYNLAEFRVLGTMWFHYHCRSILSQAKTPEELVDCVFRKLGANFMIIPEEWDLDSWNKPLREPEFLAYLKKEYTTGWFALYSLKEEE